MSLNDSERGNSGLVGTHSIIQNLNSGLVPVDPGLVPVFCFWNPKSWKSIATLASIQPCSLGLPFPERRSYEWTMDKGSMKPPTHYSLTFTSSLPCLFSLSLQLSLLWYPAVLSLLAWVWINLYQVLWPNVRVWYSLIKKIKWHAASSYDRDISADRHG